MTSEIVLMWVTVTAYAAAAVLFTVGLTFRLPRVRAAGWWVAAAGLAPHTAAIAIRWVRVGHGPGLGFYEVVSSLAWMSVVVSGLLVRRYRSLSPVGAVIMPIAFLMMGAAVLAPPSGLDITAKLASWWLTVHVTFAKLAYGALVTSFALSVLYLLREGRAAGRWREVLDKMPAQDVVDELAFKFMAVGFIFLGIMIATGAIWANEAWGRYWAWDPMETWSLVSWIVYAVVMHLRLTMGWRGTRFAWASVAALPVVVFSLVGVPIVFNSIHSGYLTGVGLE